MKRKFDIHFFLTNPKELESIKKMSEDDFIKLVVEGLKLIKDIEINNTEVDEFHTKNHTFKRLRELICCYCKDREFSSKNKHIFKRIYSGDFLSNHILDNHLRIYQTLKRNVDYRKSIKKLPEVESIYRIFFESGRVVESALQEINQHTEKVKIYNNLFTVEDLLKINNFIIDNINHDVIEEKRKYSSKKTKYSYSHEPLKEFKQNKKQLKALAKKILTTSLFPLKNNILKSLEDKILIDPKGMSSQYFDKNDNPIIELQGMQNLSDLLHYGHEIGHLTNAYKNSDDKFNGILENEASNFIEEIYSILFELTICKWLQRNGANAKIREAAKHHETKIFIDNVIECANVGMMELNFIANPHLCNTYDTFIETHYKNVKKIYGKYGNSRYYQNDWVLSDRLFDSFYSTAYVLAFFYANEIAESAINNDTEHLKRSIQILNKLNKITKKDLFEIARNCTPMQLLKKSKYIKGSSN